MVYKHADHPFGWIIAFAGFSIFFTVLGTINTYSIYSKDIARSLNRGLADVAFANSLSNGIGNCTAVFAGAILDRFGPRTVVMVAGASLALGLVGASFTDNFEVFCISYSIPIGISIACSGAPMVSVVGPWFEKYRGVAIGVVYAGSNAGSAVMPVVASRLYEAVGNDWRIAFRYLGIFGAVPLMCSLIMVKRADHNKKYKESLYNDQPESPKNIPKLLPPTPTREAGGHPVPNEITPLVLSRDGARVVTHSSAAVIAVNGTSTDGIVVEDSFAIAPSAVGRNATEIPEDTRPTWERLRPVFTGKTFIVLWLCACLTAYGFFTLIYFIIPFARAMGKEQRYVNRPEITLNQSSMLMTIFGVCGIIGNFAVGFGFDRLGPQPVYIICSAVSGVVLMCWSTLETYGAMAVGCAVIGLSSSGCLSGVSPLGIAHFVGPDLGKIMGAIFAGFGVGASIGPPVTSWIGHKSWMIGFGQAGMLWLLAAFICLVGYRPPKSAGRR